ncbi:AAA family ATPase [Aquimarina pacifica]|uniref:AAA family ATPase n=1 Tax=Aquimarina pacifica TaxID=1296415 RepID=UPI00046FA729|nr:ATP-binding protein [Aquimarina pacifica]
MAKKRIVITGAPGTGKTSIINELEKTHFFCFHEVIRTMTQEAKKKEGSKTMISNPIVSVSDPYLFNKQILTERTKQFVTAQEIEKDILFYDRGIPDVLAYMNYFGQEYEKGFIEVCQNHVYDYVFLLPPWEQIYVSDEERFESFEQAQEIHLSLKKIYTDLGYKCIEVPFGTVRERSDFILQNCQ